MGTIRRSIRTVKPSSRVKPAASRVTSTLSKRSQDTRTQTRGFDPRTWRIIPTKCKACLLTSNRSPLEWARETFDLSMRKWAVIRRIISWCRIAFSRPRMWSHLAQVIFRRRARFFKRIRETPTRSKQAWTSGTFPRNSDQTSRKRRARRCSIRRTDRAARILLFAPPAGLSTTVATKVAWIATREVRLEAVGSRRISRTSTTRESPGKLPRVCHRPSLSRRPIRPAMWIWSRVHPNSHSLLWTKSSSHRTAGPASIILEIGQPVLCRVLAEVASIQGVQAVKAKAVTGLKAKGWAAWTTTNKMPGTLTPRAVATRPQASTLAAT